MATKVEVFGNCRVVEQLASGPLTDVYHAVQEPLGRHVAIKALRPTIAPGSPFAQHLAREAELLAKLDHDNILELYDFVRTESTAWLVLEYVDGLSLADILSKQERLPVPAALAIAVQVAHALAHAHERSILHRDVKPANILVSRRGQIKLVDFGVAYDDGAASPPETLDSEATFGTPAYMSPEQILGETLDARTDIFSLGIVLYQLLSGVRPFDGPDTKSTAQRIRHSDARSLGSSSLGVSRAVERTVMRCIEKLPGDRFASARELLSALELLLRSETGSSTEELIVAELARLKVVSQTPAPRKAPEAGFAADAARTSLWPTVRVYFVLLALAVVGGIVIQQRAHKSETENSRKQGPLELTPAQPGFLRVVARPWAEVIVDGQRIDVTPFARPIPLSAGTHYVTLKHPKANDERRVIKVSHGETVLLDVTLSVRGVLQPDAGVDRHSGLELAEGVDAGF